MAIVVCYALIQVVSGTFIELVVGFCQWSTHLKAVAIVSCVIAK